MLIKCPNCLIQYEIPEEISLSEGRKLKCSSCGHVFTYHSEPQVVVEEKMPEEIIDPVLPANNDDTPESFPVFLNEQEPVVKADALTETFTPVETELKHKSEYHLSWIIVAIVGLILCVLCILGFYYSDVLTTDYLLGVDRSHKSEVYRRKDEATVARRNKIKQYVKGEKKNAVTNPSGNNGKNENEELLHVDAATEQDVEIPYKVISLTEDENNAKKTEPDVNKTEDDVPAVIEEIDDSQLTDDPVEDEEVKNSPIVQSVYFDTEETSNAREKRVRIRGTLANPSEVELILPPAVHAIAFDSEGRELFQKEIFLTSRFLEAGQSQDFFGSYIWIPSSESLEIQWIDVMF